MLVEIRPAPFDPWQELGARQALLKAGGYGACAVFIGSLRDFNQGVAVERMRLEHYPQMTEKHLQEIADTANSRWKLLELLLLHRVGEMQLGDPIVLVAVWSERRVAAFDACRFIIEDLKSRAPFWKKELTAQGERWVERNTPAG